MYSYSTLRLVCIQIFGVEARGYSTRGFYGQAVRNLQAYTHVNLHRDCDPKISRWTEDYRLIVPVLYVLMIHVNLQIVTS